MRILSLTLCLEAFLAGSALAADCADMAIQSAMNDCNNSEFTAADKKMNQVYGQLHDFYKTKGGPLFVIAGLTTRLVGFPGCHLCGTPRWRGKRLICKQCPLHVPYQPDTLKIGATRILEQL